MRYKNPIEMVRGTHYGNNFFITYSRKLSRVVKLFSNLEYYNFLMAEMDPEIIEFCEQFDEIRFPIQQTEVTFIPDMITEDIRGRLRVKEVKYEAELTGQSDSAKRSQRQIKAESSWCREMGYGFDLVTEQELMQGFLIPNLHNLAARVRKYYSPDSSNERLLRRLYDSRTELTLYDIVSSNRLPSGHELDALADLQYQGIIEMDLVSHPINGNTRIRLIK